MFDMNVMERIRSLGEREWKPGGEEGMLEVVVKRGE